MTTKRTPGAEDQPEEAVGARGAHEPEPKVPRGEDLGLGGGQRRHEPEPKVPRSADLGLGKGRRSHEPEPKVPRSADLFDSDSETDGD